MATWQKIMVGVAAVIILAAVGVGVYVGVHRWQASDKRSATGVAANPTTPTTPTPTNQPSDLPFSYFSDSVLPDVAASTCELSTDGTSVIALGTFDATGTVYPNPDGNNGEYVLKVGVIDAQLADIGSNTQNVSDTVIAANGPWQVDLMLSPGFRPSICYVGLFH